MMYVEPIWEELFQELASESSKRIYVVGNTDCGKTTFCRYLTQQLAARAPTALIDCDPGQSMLGLPTTLNTAIFTTSSPEPQEIFTRFIGDITPQRKGMYTLLAANALLKRTVERNAQFQIIDSSGYSAGPAAVEFQTAMIELLQPDLVIVFEREEELQPLVDQVERFGNIDVRRFPVTIHVKPRSMPMRREYREEKFASYFKGAELQVLDISSLVLCGSIPERFTVQSVRGRLVAFLDSEKFVLRLGLTRSIYDNDQICVCMVSDLDLEKVSFLQIGDLFLNNEFKEEHRLR